MFVSLFKKRGVKVRREKSVYARELSRYKWYSPSSFNKADAALAFLTAIVVFAILPYAITPLIRLLSGVLSVIELYCLSAIISQLAILAIAAAFCKIRKVPMFSGGGYCCRFDIKLLFPAALLAVGTAILLTPVHADFAEYMSELQYLLGYGASGDIIVDIATFDGGDIASLLLLVLVVVPVAPAICEEALFRGVVARGLGELGAFYGALLSGILFALMHGNYSQILLQFVLGAEIGYIVISTGNFSAGIVMHFVNNAFALIYSVILAFVEFGVFGAFVGAAFIILGAACVVFSLILLVKYKKRGAKLNEAKTNGSLCCLKRVGAGDEKAFSADFGFIKNSIIRKSDLFSGCEYFYKGKFYPLGKARYEKFAKNNGELAKKRAFICFLSIGLVMAVALIIFDFFGL